jgi:hypothetical protein
MRLWVRLTQSLAAALHLRACDFALWLHFDRKITHEGASASMVPFVRTEFGVTISPQIHNTNPRFV